MTKIATSAGRPIRTQARRRADRQCQLTTATFALEGGAHHRLDLYPGVCVTFAILAAPNRSICVHSQARCVAREVHAASSGVDAL
jgi:hypothetical protein